MAPQIPVLKFNPHQEKSTAETDLKRTWYPGPRAALLAARKKQFDGIGYVGNGDTVGWVLEPQEQVLRTQVGQIPDLGIIQPVQKPQSATIEVEERFQILQKWEGVVLRINKDGTFIARLYDQSSLEGGDEEAEFVQSDIAEGDRTLFQQGAVFYWSIGYRNTLDGQLQRISELRFRRLPSWTQREIAASKQEVQAIQAILGKYSTE